MGGVEDLIERAPERARKGIEGLNDAVLAKVDEEGPMKAFATLFVLLSVSAVSEIGDAFYEPQLHAAMLGQLEDPSEPWSVAAGQQLSFAQLPFKEAVEYFRGKKVMTSSEFADLERRTRDRAFTMAGTHSRYVLESAHEALFRALQDGSTDRVAHDRIKQAFADAGVESPTDFHLQTVFDTSILGAYAGGRYAQMTTSTALANRPYWEYITAGDGRVRPAHQAMAHRTFPADSPTWQTWFPPNGYRCRCSARALSRSEVEARGLEVEAEAPAGLKPDPGFSGGPATQPTADHAIATLRHQAQNAGVLGQAARDLNRADDAERAARLDSFADLDGAAIKRMFVFGPEPKKKLSATSGRALSSFAVELPINPRPGLFLGEWALYSQDLDSFEQLVARLVQTPGLEGIGRHNDLELVPRAVYVAAWDPIARHEAEVIFDAQLSRELDVIEGHTTARLSEYALRLHILPGELSRALAFLLDNGERSPGATPVRRAWEVADLRVRAGAGVQLGDHHGWSPAYRHAWDHGPGRELVTLSRFPSVVAGGASEMVLVNRRQWEGLV